MACSSLPGIKGLSWEGRIRRTAFDIARRPRGHCRVRIAHPQCPSWARRLIDPPEVMAADVAEAGRPAALALDMSRSGGALRLLCRHDYVGGSGLCLN